MAGDDFFQKVSQTFDENLMAGINGVISNGLAWAQPQLRAAATLFILITAWLVLTGRMDKSVLAGRVIRIMAVAALLTSAGTFNTYVRDLFLNTIPSSVGAALSGATVSAPAAQFDAIWNATQRLAADVLAQATGWTQVGERVAIYAILAVTLVPLIVIFLIWVVARVVMGMVIALGPFIIGLWLFDATRPFVQRWVGKLMSLTLVQVSVGVMLQMLVAGFTTYLRAAQGNFGRGTSEQLAALLQIAGWYWCGLLLLASLGVVAYSIGGGLATSFAPVTQSAAGMTNAFAGRFGRGSAMAGGALGRGIQQGTGRLRGSSTTSAPAAK